MIYFLQVKLNLYIMNNVGKNWDDDEEEKLIKEASSSSVSASGGKRRKKRTRKHKKRSRWIRTRGRRRL